MARPRARRAVRALPFLPAAFAVLGVTLATATPARAADTPATDVAVGGLGATLTRSRGGDRDAQAVAYGLSSSRIGFGYEKPFSVRVINSGWFGAGTHGLQGGLGNALAGGVLLPVGAHQGFVLRGGVEGSFFGNQYLWDSLLELPQVHLGYQWLVPRAVADVALKGGYVLWGRHNTGDAAMRELDGTFELGGIGAVHLGPVDVHASYTHMFLRGAGRPIDVFDAGFCGIARRLALCTAVRYETGDELLPDATFRFDRVSFIGFTLGTTIDRLRVLKKK